MMGSKQPKSGLDPAGYPYACGEVSALVFCGHVLEKTYESVKVEPVRDLPAFQEIHPSREVAHIES